MSGLAATVEGADAAVGVAAVCPRCGGGFACGVNNSAEAPCACAGMQLSAGLLQQLRTQYPCGCLCLRCLAALQGAHAQGAHRT